MSLCIRKLLGWLVKYRLHPSDSVFILATSFTDLPFYNLYLLKYLEVIQWTDIVKSRSKWTVQRLQNSSNNVVTISMGFPVVYHTFQTGPFRSLWSQTTNRHRWKQTRTKKKKRKEKKERKKDHISLRKGWLNRIENVFHNTYPIPSKYQWQTLPTPPPSHPLSEFRGFEWGVDFPPFLVEPNYITLILPSGTDKKLIFYP